MKSNYWKTRRCVFPITLLALYLAGCYPPTPVLKTYLAAPPPTAVSSNNPAATGNATAYPSPPIKAVLFISDLSFVNAQRGWLIGALCPDNSECTLAMRNTLDGGATWSPAPSPLTGFTINGEPGPSHHVRRLRFVNPQVGWAFDPGLFATQDGGQTWQDVSPGQPVVALERAGDSVWMIMGDCTNNPECSFKVMSFNQDKKSWQPLAVQPSIRGPELQMVRSSPKDAWILSWGALNTPTNTPYGSALVATHDAGQTWQTLPTPCEKQPVNDRLAAIDSIHLWALCGGLPGAGQQMKYLRVASDGGRTWGQQVDLSGEGYVDELATATEQRGFIGLGRGTLLISEDRGSTWKPAIDISTANPTDTSGWRILFIDPLHGWASLGNQVFRTTDGGERWDKIEVK